MTRLAIRSLWARRVRAGATSLAVHPRGRLHRRLLRPHRHDLSPPSTKSSASRCGDRRRGHRPRTRQHEGGEAPTVPRLLPAEGPEGRRTSRKRAGRSRTPWRLLRRRRQIAIGPKFAPKSFSSSAAVQGSIHDSSTAGQPRGPREVLVDEAAAARAGLHLGDTAQDRRRAAGAAVQARRADRSFGRRRPSAAPRSPRSTLPAAQRAHPRPRPARPISVAADPGVTPATLIRRIDHAAARGAGRDGDRTGRPGHRPNPRQPRLPDRRSCSSSADRACFVGAFVIFNTLLDHRRPAHLGVRRCCGRSAPRAGRSSARCCSRRWRDRRCSAPSSGSRAGYVVAAGLHAAFRAFGADLPTTGLVLESRTVIVSVARRPVVTFLSALVPAPGARPGCRRSRRCTPSRRRRPRAAGSACWRSPGSSPRSGSPSSSPGSPAAARSARGRRGSAAAGRRGRRRLALQPAARAAARPTSPAGRWSGCGG